MDSLQSLVASFSSYVQPLCTRSRAGHECVSAHFRGAVPAIPVFTNCAFSISFQVGTHRLLQFFFLPSLPHESRMDDRDINKSDSTLSIEQDGCMFGCECMKVFSERDQIASARSFISFVRTAERNRRHRKNTVGRGPKSLF